MKREKRIKDNRALINSLDGFEMPFPTEESVQNYPTHIREVFQYMQSMLSANDLVSLLEGETYEETLINVYFKILDKINLVLIRANDFIQ